MLEFYASGCCCGTCKIKSSHIHDAYTGLFVSCISTPFNSFQTLLDVLQYGWVTKCHSQVLGFPPTRNHPNSFSFYLCLLTFDSSTSSITSVHTLAQSLWVRILQNSDPLRNLYSFDKIDSHSAPESNRHRMSREIQSAFHKHTIGESIPHASTGPTWRPESDRNASHIAIRNA